jgi:hypothetical protein
VAPALSFSSVAHIEVSAAPKFHRGFTMAMCAWEIANNMLLPTTVKETFIDVLVAGFVLGA